MSAIRPATEADIPAILAIYNDAVLNTTAIWNETPADLDNRRAWFATRKAQGYPVLVADSGGGAIGYASFGDWRSFEGYRHTVEHSVYVANGVRGGGIGSALVLALLEAARGLGKHVMLGGIEAGNVASIRLHEKLGFVETARMPGVGVKFGRRLDLVFMQRDIG